MRSTKFPTRYKFETMSLVLTEAATRTATIIVETLVA